MQTKILGKPIDRVDALLKVTGRAKYAAEFPANNLAYAYPVRSRIANGTITKIETAEAEKSGGVIKILTHENAVRLKEFNQQEFQKSGGMLGDQFVPLQDNRVRYFKQYIGLVVAETYEQARAAARLIKVTYAANQPKSGLEKNLANGMMPQKARGEDVQINPGKTAGIINSAPVKIEQTYRTSTENHHPMEPHATIAVWDANNKLKLYDATQGVKGVQGSAAYFFELPPENVQVISPYVGGGFGCKGSQWHHIFLTAMAAKVVNRPVKFAITRQMMTNNVGRRPETIQKVALASDKTGKLVALRHENNSYKAYSEYFEQSGLPSKILYSAPVREITYKITELNYNSPTFMRAPGETPGSFALESAMDELAYELKIDPIQLRILNHTAVNPMEKLPFSSEFLRDCFKVGAEKFGWSNRKAQPRQTRMGKTLVGYGMATATYPANRSQASVRIKMTANGAVEVYCATQDIGTGTYTIMAQTASDALGVPVEKIRVEIGDSMLPPAPVSGGSQTAVSVTSAVLAAADLLKKNLRAMAIADKKSNLNGRRAEEIRFENAKFFVVGDSSKTDSPLEILRRSQQKEIEVCATAKPFSSKKPNENNEQAKKDDGGQNNDGGAPCSPIEPNAERDSNKDEYSFHSFGAQFAEVRVDEDTGVIRVARFASVHDVGRILNEKTARSQIIGGVVYGLGQALTEETQYDDRFAFPVQRTFGDYHIPVQLDVPPIDVFFIGKPDPHISLIGARGIGEIGITGVAAAVANAVFNATGRRVRDLPLTPDKLL